MPERPRQSDEWLKEQTITWLSRVEVCHVTVLKRHHKGQQPDVGRSAPLPDRLVDDGVGFLEALQRIASL
jgi:hypothetical protein